MNTSNSIYFHYDKSGLVADNINRSQTGNSFIVTGSESLNAFPMGLLSLENNLVVKNIMPDFIFKEVCEYFRSRNSNNIGELISNCRQYVRDWYSARIYREIVFENVRIQHFSELPSRLSCIFLCEYEQDLDRWLKEIPKELETYFLYKFQAQNPDNFKLNNLPVRECCHVADAKYLENKSLDIGQLELNAFKYWEGRNSDEPLVEILYYGILKVLEVKQKAHTKP